MNDDDGDQGSGAETTVAVVEAPPAKSWGPLARRRQRQHES
jgi:hypothetical protein